MEQNLEELYLVDEESESSKIKRFDIISYNIDKAIETIIKWKNNGKLVIPTFQREFVWKFNTSCKLIDSILLNLPIPGLFVCKRIMNSEEKYFLIDGLQRVTTIEQFINGKYISDETQETKEFKINLKNSEWYGETFLTLDENDKQNFLDYDLSLTVFEIPEKNESKNLNSMYEIFERINTGSEKLTAQEIRNAIYSGDLLNNLKEICSTSETFKSLISNDKIYSKRKKDQELLLRFVCYYYVYTRFNSNTNLYVDNSTQVITTSKIETLNNYLYFSNLNSIDYKLYLNNVLEALEVVSSFCNNAFYSVSRDKDSISNKVQEVFAEALIIAVIINDYKINISKEQFGNIKLQIWKDENLYKKFTEKTTAKDAIMDRVNLMLGIIKDGRLL